MDRELRTLIRDIVIGAIVGLLASWLVWGNGLLRIINWVRT
jgi:uncharacterized membrane protein YeaQ/YmgE (transglycosylase-associated protein family)